MSARKSKKRLRTDRLIILGVLFVCMCGFVLYGSYRLYRVVFPVKEVPEAVVPEKKDVTSENRTADHTRQIEEIKNANALDTVNVTGLSDEELRSLFYSSELTPEQLSSMTGRTWSDDQDFVKPEDLRYIRVLYQNFDNQSTVGEIIMNKDLAAEIEDIFFDLYKHEYQIERMILPDAYGGDDNQSMSNNNTSGFSLRLSDGVSLWPHEHALGLAVDLNPLMNPFVVSTADNYSVSPESAQTYADRTNIRPHMIDHNDYAYQLFTSHGFTWGGDWNERTDYQHFEKGYTPPETLPEDVQKVVDSTKDDQSQSQEDQEEGEALPEEETAANEDAAE
ncbi:M15 family metallopeptidase [Ileibacterium valens]|uniref:M15 family metallopeptidase n=1 Tax=Ileibacterium valens TaxID=1862668 RepID=UPI0024BB54CB|nr:M15 family metallopeptidase [Ileibacterium valens]